MKYGTDEPPGCYLIFGTVVVWKYL